MFPRAGSIVNPDEFIPIFKQFPNLKLTLDIGHANIGSKFDKRNLEFINKLGDRIGHVHASDNFGKDDNHLPIGAGVINFKKIIKRLKKIGYDDTVTLEIFSKDREYLRISRENFDAMIAG
jgi:sugar phosphate isomerase/epimerase